MRSGLTVGSSVWVVSERWVWLVVWCSACVASAGYLRCACWCRCVDGGGLSACPPVELVPAFGGYCGGWGQCPGRLVCVVGCGCVC